ncbi:MAG: hypothetical protein F4Y58_01670 [Gammaproteobacteria bacterium]|nr:hypothetical protein [Gammaproteobacteria bacterium]
METTIDSILKYNALPAAALSVVIYLQAGTSGDIQDMRGDIQALRTETNAEFRALRTEMAEGHQEIRAEMVKGDQAIRAEMNAEFQSIRAEMAAGDQSIRAELANTNERLARVETRLTSIERVLYADIEPPAP